MSAPPEAWRLLQTGDIFDRMIPRLALLALLVVGCSDPSTSSSQPKASRPQLPVADEASDKAAASVLTDPHRFDCKIDTDCTNSCKHGAVSVTWYRKAETAPDFPECQDGCANQISAPPRCEDGGCVAYQVDPQDESVVTTRDYCTRVGE